MLDWVMAAPVCMSMSMSMGMAFACMRMSCLRVKMEGLRQSVRAKAAAELMPSPIQMQTGEKTSHLQLMVGRFVRLAKIPNAARGATDMHIVFAKNIAEMQLPRLHISTAKMVVLVTLGLVMNRSIKN